MNKLAVLLVYGLLVNWAMVALGLNQVRNAGLGDIAYLLESLITLWVLSSIGSKPVPGPLLGSAGILILLCGAWEAATVGFTVKWPRTETVSGLIIGSICLWRLLQVLVQDDHDAIWQQPAFWLLGSWSLLIGVELTFFPMHNLFLKRLTGDWLFVPWSAKYVIGLILNLGVARTFLCPKPSSS